MNILPTAEFMWFSARLDGPKRRAAYVQLGYHRGLARLSLFELSPSLQGRALMARTFLSLNPALHKLGVREMTLKASMQNGGYVWAADGFRAPHAVPSARTQMLKYLETQGDRIRAATGATASDLEALRRRVRATRTMRGLARSELRDAKGRRLRVPVDRRAEWGLRRNHKLGSYSIGKLFFLSRVSRIEMRKDYSRGHNSQTFCRACVAIASL